MILGPLTTEANADILKDVCRLRMSVYQLHGMEYLIREAVSPSKEEVCLDRRSVHFCAVSDQEVIGSVRLTPFPFEATALSPDLAVEAEEYKKHVEIARLVVQPLNARGDTTAILLKTAYQWAFQQNFVGVIGLCRNPVAALLKHYGIKTACGPCVIPARGLQEYWMMVAHWGEIAGILNLTGKLDPIGE